MSVNINVPCPDFPPVSADLKVTLPFGELKAFRDFSLSLPTDCNLTFNLLLQYTFCAQLACLGDSQQFFVRRAAPEEERQP